LLNAASRKGKKGRRESERKGDVPGLATKGVGERSLLPADGIGGGTRGIPREIKEEKSSLTGRSG